MVHADRARSRSPLRRPAPRVYPNGAPGIQDGHIYAGTLRLTYQLNEKNKFSAFWLRNWKYKGHEILDGGQGGFIPADPSVTATQRNRWPMYYILQTKWTGTLTPRLVTEVGMSLSHLDYNDIYQDGILLYPEGTQAFYANTTQRDQGTLRRYVAGRSNQYFQTTRNYFSGTTSYITGSHQIKVGVQDSFGPYHIAVTENGDGYTTFTNGVPTSFTAINTPYSNGPGLTRTSRSLRRTPGISNDSPLAQVSDGSIWPPRFSRRTPRPAGSLARELSLKPHATPSRAWVAGKTGRPGSALFMTYSAITRPL